MIRSTARRTLMSQGFTLIELMIALVLGLLIIGATVTAFLSNQQTSRVMTELGNAQEAFRFASQTIMRVVQQGSSMRDPGTALLSVVIAPGEGKMDCLGRPVGTTVDSVINTFSINVDGELLCRVDVVDSVGVVTFDEEAVLVEGLDPDPERSNFTFGIAEIANGYWKDNTLWGEPDADDWLNVRSVRVQLAKLAGGEAIGATAVFSATMRCAVLGC
jgi:prepilin-type N-terminal cleavage/methylation domain-containing protein